MNVGRSIVSWWFWHLMLVGPAFLLVLSADEIISAAIDPGEYPFGWEGGGWKYRSSGNYVIANFWTLLFAGFCLFGGFRGKRKIIIWPARVFSILATIPVMTTLSIESSRFFDLSPTSIRAALWADAWIPYALFPFIGSIPR